MGLLPGRWRRPVISLVVFSAVGVIALGFRYGGGSSAGRVDGVIDEELLRAGTGHLQILQLVAALGGPPVLVLASCMLGLVTWRNRTRIWWAELVATASPTLAASLTEKVLKPLIDRTHGGGLALPSGHATSISALATAVVLLCAAKGFPQRRGLRWALLGVAGLVVASVSVAQVSLDRHYASDTVAGVLTGISVVGFLALILDHLARRHTPISANTQ